MEATISPERFEALLARLDELERNVEDLGSLVAVAAEAQRATVHGASLPSRRPRHLTAVKT